MNDDGFLSLGDILQAALDDNDPKEYIRKRQAELSADALGAFLKTLPETVNTFQLLSTITQFVGEDIINETLRNLMGILPENGYYVLQTLNGFVRPDKIAAIKIVREVTNAGLREAKDFVEATAPLKLAANDARRIDDMVKEFGYRLVAG